MKMWTCGTKGRLRLEDNIKMDLGEIGAENEN
jgi:hypothetical protein